MNQIVPTKSAENINRASFQRLVLVVDDSRAHRQLLVKTLRKWGYATLEASSGENALEICRAKTVDIVISDWLMPGISGVEFCRLFRALSVDRPGYFILLTAQSDKKALVEGLDSGADDFLSKPFNSTEIRARIKSGERVVQAQREIRTKNKELLETLKELSSAYAALDRDLVEARKFQEALVPQRYIPIGTTDLTMLFRPSGHVGGDLVGYFWVDEHTIGVYSLDVAGHGVCSALMTARVASYLSSATPDRNIALVDWGEGYSMLPPEEVCHRLNDLLQADQDTDQYLTMSIARLNLKSGEVDLCQAGHPSPMLQRADGSVEFLKLYSMPIGLIDYPEFASMSLTLREDERLMLYSDGITECPGEENEMLDEAGLSKILFKHSSKRGQSMVDAMLVDLGSFSGHQDFPDDLSAVLIERFREEDVARKADRRRSRPILPLRLE